MRILIIGSGSRGSLEGIYQRALRSLGEDVDFFDVDPHMTVPRSLRTIGRLANNRFTFHLWAARAGRALLSYLASISRPYDIVFIFKGMQFSAEVLREGLHLQRSSTWVNVNPDDPFNTDSVSSTNIQVIRSIPFFDLYCIWSHRLLEPIRTAGCKKVIYLPFGYDPGVHPPPTVAELGRPRSISFIGAWDRERQTALEGLAHLELRVFGGAWGRVSSGSPLAHRIVGRDNIYGQELANEVSSAAVSLNLMRSQNRGSHNMRTFEVPAMGGLLLTTRSEEQEEYFPEGKASLMFDDHEELSEKIKWVLSNPDQAAKIRAHGRARVLHHTYQERARTVLDEVRKLRGERQAR